MRETGRPARTSTPQNRSQPRTDRNLKSQSQIAVSSRNLQSQSRADRSPKQTAGSSPCLKQIAVSNRHLKQTAVSCKFLDQFFVGFDRTLRYPHPQISTPTAAKSFFRHGIRASNGGSKYSVLRGDTYHICFVAKCLLMTKVGCPVTSIVSTPSS